MSDVFRVLRLDHETIKAMLVRLESDRVAPGADPDLLRARTALAERLIIEECRHEAVEEEFFWPAVREHVPGGDALADEGTGQEQRAKELLSELDGLAAGDEGFEDLVTGLAAETRTHLTFEETRVWPRLRRTLPATQATLLGTRLAKGKTLAPTHPHPRIAPEPGILRASGPLTAAADRIRDAATGRGRDLTR
jgi:Hemerythrin HHE cation binding domain